MIATQLAGVDRVSNIQGDPVGDDVQNESEFMGKVTAFPSPVEEVEQVSLSLNLDGTFLETVPHISATPGNQGQQQRPAKQLEAESAPAREAYFLSGRSLFSGSHFSTMNKPGKIVHAAGAVSPAERRNGFFGLDYSLSGNSFTAKIAR